MKNSYGVYFLLCLSFTKMLLSSEYEKPIVVVTASYNNKDWYKSNLGSIFNQNYENWRLIYIDDDSLDGTTKLAKSYTNACNMQHKVTFIKNSTRKGALANQYHAIHTCDDHAIIIIVDGDDMLAHPYVFAYINQIYSSADIWLTYGQFIFLSNKHKGICSPIPPQIIENNQLREYPYIASHLRTFYAALFKKIKKNDLMFNGVFYPMTGDMAAMVPMIEMARNNHFAFIDDILLVYNNVNVLNDCKISRETQMFINRYIRSLPRYEALTTLFN